MTIEFECRYCQKVLSAPDDKAGSLARCPQCGETISVPVPEGMTSLSRADEGGSDTGTPVPEESSFLAEGTLREEESVLSTGQTVCPMCGEEAPAGALNCDYCGETLQSPGPGSGEPRKIEVGAVLSRAWGVFSSNLGRVIGVHFLAYILAVLCSVAVLILFIALGVGAVALLGEPEPGVLIALGILGYIVVLLINAVFQFYFLLGVLSYILKLVRGEQPSFNELFSGWPYLGRMLLCSLLFIFMYALGYICLIIPGIIIALMFGAYPYLLIDRNLPGIESLTQSRKITQGNLMSLFLISLVLGSIVLVPYLSLVFATVGMDRGAGPPVWFPIVMIFFMAFVYLFLIPFSVLVGGTCYAEMTNQ
ncbi:hypothetical protein Enr10x_12710 [Gimesia panareensis]|uniref:Double zinc ribbon n=1 Tax=Gimesia panareensis TaxID=2527978 RepID=A0A517Q2W8_9PLAN|nr:zinc ribbon domain-containing protein [Gimesia panareensis]QDT25973.1 hypothetical protein Enr10x_12710 [Gimesia panareensis]